MKTLRLYISISMLLASLNGKACWWPAPEPCDNMIYRLMEDVSPYYFYDMHPYFNPSNSTVSNEYFRKENVKLWREQTGTTISDAMIENYVYGFSAKKLSSKKTDCVKHLGEDAYEFLLFAKQCEEVRAELNDPWYYPTKNDPVVAALEDVAKKGMTHHTKYQGRYALQTLRALIELCKYDEAVKYWEKMRQSLPDDIIKVMAERHVARAYLRTGKSKTAYSIYARIGDLISLYDCVRDHRQMWEAVLKENPNSPFFKDVLQSMLTHFDNRYLNRGDREYRGVVWYSCDGHSEEKRDIAFAKRMAWKAIGDNRVKDKAMWYYALAAFTDAEGDPQKALQYVRVGQNCCEKGSFMEKTMRVLRIYLEAQTSPYDTAYIQRLAGDVEWLSQLGREKISGYSTMPQLYYKNVMYWGDAINRILADVLASRLLSEGKKVDALLLANLGEFWMSRNLTGNAHSMNSPGRFWFTDHNNFMSEMVDNSSANTLITMFRRIQNPMNVMDRLVKNNGMADSDYWCDIIGSHLIAEHRYAEAVLWLARSSSEYQRNCSTWEWYSRDPFCLKIGWSTGNRHHISRKCDYKQSYAKRMCELERQMRTAKSQDKRAEAMILYGVGMRNQSDWCWALTRYSDFIDTHDDFVDKKRSQAMIDKGLRLMQDNERKAFYLNAFARNKEVMDLCPDTKIAKKLRARCDLWRDYKKK